MRQLKVKLRSLFKSTGVLVTSILLHDTRKTQLLIDFGANVDTSYHLSALCWAETLGLSDIAKMLKAANAQFLRSKSCDALCGLVSLNVNTLINVQYMVEHGYSINGEKNDGMPLYLAFKNENIKVAEYLLQKGSETLLCFKRLDNHEQLLMSLVNVNVDLSSDDKGLSLIQFYSNKIDYLKFIIMSAHTITRRDKIFLESLLTSDEIKSSLKEEYQTLINQEIMSPKRLSVACRDSFRKHYRLNFIQYMNAVETHIPKEIVKVLTCEDLITDFKISAERHKAEYDILFCRNCCFDDFSLNNLYY